MDPAHNIPNKAIPPGLPFPRRRRIMPIIQTSNVCLSNLKNHHGEFNSSSLSPEINPSKKINSSKLRKTEND